MIIKSLPVNVNLQLLLDYYNNLKLDYVLLSNTSGLSDYSESINLIDIIISDLTDLLKLERGDINC